MGGRYCAIYSHGVRRGGKNPRTECRGIPPPLRAEASLLQNTEAHVEMLLSTQLNVSVWWRHIYLGRHNNANRHAPAEHFEYFICENCTQTTRVYRCMNAIESLYIYSW